MQTASDVSVEGTTFKVTEGSSKATKATQFDPYWVYRPKSRGHFVLRLITLEILIRSASNLAQIKFISFLTVNRNLFESSLENKMAPSSE